MKYIIMALVQKIINIRYAKYFRELRSNPEYQEAIQGLKGAADRIEVSSKRFAKAKIKWQKDYDEHVAEHGKAETDAMISKFYKSIE